LSVRLELGPSPPPPTKRGVRRVCNLSPLAAIRFTHLKNCSFSIFRARHEGCSPGRPNQMCEHDSRLRGEVYKQLEACDMIRTSKSRKLDGPPAISAQSRRAIVAWRHAKLRPERPTEMRQVVEAPTIGYFGDLLVPMSGVSEVVPAAIQTLRKNIPAKGWFFRLKQRVDVPRRNTQRRSGPVKRELRVVQPGLDVGLQSGQQRRAVGGVDGRRIAANRSMLGRGPVSPCMIRSPTRWVPKSTMLPASSTRSKAPASCWRRVRRYRRRFRCRSMPRPRLTLASLAEAQIASHSAAGHIGCKSWGCRSLDGRSNMTLRKVRESVSTE